MPYLPPKIVLDATITPAGAYDLVTAVDLINEKFSRHYPAVQWHMLDFAPTAAADAGESRLSGGSTGVKFDTLYGEAVPLNASRELEQPHGSSAVDATDRRKWKPPVSINAFVRRMGPVVDVLTTAGAQGYRNYQFVVPTGLADSVGLTVQVGDKVEVGGVTAVVTQAQIPERAYWRFTNIPLYIVCEARSLALES